MPTWSRRRALQAIGTAVTAGIAGCNTEISSDDTETVPADRSRSRVSDYEVLKVRSPDGRSLVTSAESEDRSDERSGPVPVYDHLKGENLDRWQFRTDVEDGKRLQSFVNGTDFDANSIYLFQRAVPECYEVRLVSVTREPDSVSADFCRDLRPADVECSTEVGTAVAFAIRLPFSGDEMSDTGAGMSSSCRGAFPAARSAGGDDAGTGAGSQGGGQ